MKSSTRRSMVIALVLGCPLAAALGEPVPDVGAADRAASVGRHAAAREAERPRALLLAQTSATKGPQAPELSPNAPKPTATAPKPTATKFRPRTIGAGTLSMTGYRFQPKTVEAGALRMAGYRHQPQTIYAGTLKMHGFTK